MTATQLSAIASLRDRFDRVETSAASDTVTRVDCYMAKRAVVAFIGRDGEVVEFKDQA